LYLAVKQHGTVIHQKAECPIKASMLTKISENLVEPDKTASQYFINEVWHQGLYLLLGTNKS